LRRVAQPGLLACVVAIVGTPPLAAQDAPPLDIRFLTYKEAAAAIVDDAQAPYFSLLQPLEMLVKTGTPFESTDPAKQRDEPVRYRDAVREFTDDEKAAVTDAVRGPRRAGGSYPLVAPWRFLKLGSPLECRPALARAVHRPARLRHSRWRNAQGGEHPARLFGEMILREQHVVERAHPEISRTSSREWGLVRAKGLPSCPWLDRFSPSTRRADVGWVIAEKSGGTTEHWQPLRVLDDAAPVRAPQNLVSIGVRLDRKGASFAPHVAKDAVDGKPEIKLLSLVEGYAAAFGHATGYHHPAETCACLFSWMAMYENVAKSGPGLANHANVDFTKFRVWCRAKLHK
jgi:hypothetical protein